jgi:hypothetical protein
MELNMQDDLVRGLIAAVIQHADSGDMHGFRLDVVDAQGRTVTYMSDTRMYRSNSDPAPMSVNAALRLIDGAGLRVSETPNASVA